MRGKENDSGFREHILKQGDDVGYGHASEESIDIDVSGAGELVDCLLSSVHAKLANC